MKLRCVQFIILVSCVEYCFTSLVYVAAYGGRHFHLIVFISFFFILFLTTSSLGVLLYSLQYILPEIGCVNFSLSRNYMILPLRLDIRTLISCLLCKPERHCFLWGPVTEND